MCGRFVLDLSPDILGSVFSVEVNGPFAPRYNIAPGQPVAAVCLNEGRERVFAHMLWGLIPHWMKEAPAKPMINARMETILDKPSFRAAVHHRRCLVPASGFYEWKAEAGGKQPCYIYPEEGQGLAIAGIWEHWTGPGGDGGIDTLALVTTEAPPAIAGIHHRAPVMLAQESFALWLGEGDHAGRKPGDVLKNLVMIEDSTLSARRVSKRVNRTANDGPDLIRAEGKSMGQGPAQNYPAQEELF